ncbi:MAG: DUF1343 domain-containing protein [Spirochaetota bacterium]|nr:DUF1343 domain-containing protein [Spirochaetota bacterium]
MRRFQVIILAFCIIFSFCSSGKRYYHIPAKNERRVYSGLEYFIEKYAHAYKKRSAVVVTNHSGLDYYLQRNIDLFRDNGIEIAFILVPEHGLYGYQNDYDKEMYNVSEELNAIVYNMHKLNKASLKSLLSIADIVIFDIQDMGMRCYTYISNLKFVMDVLNGEDKELIVLDRPNPIGFLGVDGSYLDEKFFSRYISAFPVPFIYGMTIGESALYYKGEFVKDVMLNVIPLVNYDRDMLYNETMLPWVPPSPNLPTFESSVVYSAVVLLEGINISLGRGTTKPFEYLGAPWIEPISFCEGLKGLGLCNFNFRPICFKPTFSKHKDEKCGGVHILYMGGRFSPTEVSYRLIRYIMETYKECKWEKYRDGFDIDYLAGTDKLREAITRGMDYRDFYDEIKDEIENYRKVRAKYLLY